MELDNPKMSAKPFILTGTAIVTWRDDSTEVRDVVDVQNLVESSSNQKTGIDVEVNAMIDRFAGRGASGRTPATKKPGQWWTFKDRVS